MLTKNTRVQTQTVQLSRAGSSRNVQNPHLMSQTIKHYNRLATGHRASGSQVVVEVVVVVAAAIV